MKFRIITTLVAWLGAFALIHAANGVTVTGAQGTVGNRVEITVDLTTDGDNVSAAEIHIPLPDGVTPVAGSCVKVDSRLPGHSVSANMKGNDYVIVIFNTTLTPIPAGSGPALKFSLDLGENPGEFELKPAVTMSDASGRAVSANAEGGTLTVLGARLELSATDIDFGRVPIRGTYTREVTATNTGTTTLEIADITTDVPGLKVTTATTSVAPGSNTKLTLNYSPIERSASIAGRFTVESNSVGRAPFVRVTSVPFSVNELYTSSADGIADTEVTVTLSMSNMEPITGVEAIYNLPEGLDYVSGSVEAASRASGLKAEAVFGSGRQLRLLLYSVGNTAISGTEGDILSFRLRLSGRSGRYTLNPAKVILSNRSGENMVSATSGGYVTIAAPALQAQAQWKIGNVPLSGDNTFRYNVSNSGNAPLKIEKVVFLNDIARCDAEFPIVVEAGKSGEIPISIKNPVFGNFATTMNVYTNDPDNSMKSVAVTGRFYSTNSVSASGHVDGENYVMSVGLDNEAPIVAMQLDVLMPDGVAPTSSDIKLLDRAGSHNVTVAEVGKNSYRIIIFSLSNTPFTGNSGDILSMTLPVKSLEGREIKFENIKLSNAEGVNYTAPDTDILVSTVPVFVREITLSVESTELKVGESIALEATVLPEDATDKSVNWTTSDEAVVTVDADGKVTAVSLGEAVITATCGSVSATCKVSVVATPAESIALNHESAQLKVGESITLEATVLPEDATDKSVTWTTSDEAVVTVDADGKVNAVSLGEAVITATCGSVSATCKVSVVATPAESIALNHESAQLKVGESIALEATVLPEDATDKSVNWTTSDEAVVTVDADGKVTAVSLGEAVITATCGSVSATCKVSVVATPAESIALNHESAQLKVGESITLEATVLPEDATDKSVTWTTSDEAVVTVDADGKVTAVGTGKATITATLNDNSVISASCDITVDELSGIDVADVSKVDIRVENRTIIVSGLKDNIAVSVMRTDGKRIFTCVPEEAIFRYEIETAGLYIVVAGNSVKKIVVR